MTPPLSVLIADDYIHTRLGLQALLSHVEDVRVVAEAASAQEAIHQAVMLKPDVVLMDLVWYGDNTAGIAAIRAIKKAEPQVRILAVTAYDHLIPTARRAGADVAVDKGVLMDAQSLAQHIRDAAHAQPLDLPLDKLIAFPASCFISHSSQDKAFCDRLHRDLTQRNVSAWYFPADAKWGELVWGEIDQSIGQYDRLIVVCSRNALKSSPVLREIERALQREDREKNNILFPITIDGYLFREWQHPRQVDVLSKVVGDFRGWRRRQDQYQHALERLLRALGG